MEGPVADALTKAFYDKGKVILSMPLGTRVALGSVGYIDDGQWVEVSNTKAMFGIALAAPSSTVRPNSFDGKSGRNLKFEVKASGETSALVGDVAKAQARTEVVFGSAGAFVMSVRNQVVPTAGNLASLMQAIRFAYRFRKQLPEGRRWERKYAVVVGVASAESVVTLLSRSKDASAIITGSAGLSTPTVPAQIDAKMSVTFSRESVEKLWQGPATEYAFRAMVIAPSMFTSWDREDLVYLSPSRAPGRAAFGLGTSMPRSWAAWAKSARFNAGTPLLGELGPSGRIAFKRTAGVFLKSKGYGKRTSGSEKGPGSKQRLAKKGLNVIKGRATSSRSSRSTRPRTKVSR
jgi:hypothetical protein